MSSFCFYLVVAVVALTFALSFLGVGKVWAAAAVVAVVVLVFAVKHFGPLIMFMIGVHQTPEEDG